MAEDKLDILIQTQANTEGLDRLNKSLDKLNEKNDQADKKQEKHAESLDHIRRLYLKLDTVLPGVGSLMEGVFSPGGAAISALVVLIDQLTNAFEAYSKKLEKVIQQQAAIDTAVWSAQLDAVNAAKTAAESYNQTLQSILGSQDKIKAGEDLRLTTLKAIADEQSKILDAQEAAEKAAAKGNDVAIAEIEERYGRKKSAQQIGAEGAELKAARSTQQLQQRQVEEALAASHAAEMAQERGPQGADQAAAAQAWIEAHKDDVQQAQVELLKAQHAAGGHTPEELRAIARMSPWNSPQAQLGTTADQLEEAQKKLAAAKSAQEAATAAVNAHKAATDALAAAASKAADKLKSATAALDATIADIEKREAVLKIHQRTNAETTDIATGSTLTAAGLPAASRAGRTILAGVRAEEAVAHGERLNQGQMQAIQTIVSALHATGASQDKINEVLAMLRDLTVSQVQKITIVAQDLKILQSQVRTMQTNSGG